MIIDCHCDTLLQAYLTNRLIYARSTSGHLDLPRLQESGVKIQFFALFPGIPSSLNPLKQILILGDFFWEQYDRNQEKIKMVTSSSDLVEVMESDKIGVLLTVEGGEVLEGELSILRILYRLGVRSLCLTWNNRNEIADGVAEKEGRGLTEFGRKVVKEMNKLGMIIDLSHMAEKGFWDVLELSDAPVIASHSNSRVVWDHPRNLTDEQIKGIAQKKGLVGLNFVSEFIGAPGAGMEKLLEHIDHILDLVGDDYLAFGSDFDGTDNLLSNFRDVTIYPEIIAELEKRNYKGSTIQKICWGNCLRILQQIL